MNNDTTGPLNAQTLPTGANGWSRLLGISLRPWSGLSPLSLIARGLIRIALCLFFAFLILQFLKSEELAAVIGDNNGPRIVVVVLTITLILGAAIGVFSVVIGVLDLVPRRTVTGTVMSLGERKAFDFLPEFVQRLVFERNPNEIDKRRVRTEVVLRTDTGSRQWTVRKSGLVRDLQPGAHVALTVTPITGFVAHAQRSV